MRSFLAICILTTFFIALGISLLPAVIGAAGFWIGSLLMIGVWLFIVLSSLIYLEATLANPDGANMASISRNLLGKASSVISSIAFIYVHTSILTIYFLFGSLLLKDLTHIPLQIPLILIVGFFLFMGLRWCGWLAALCLAIVLGILVSLLQREGGAFHPPPFKPNWLYLLLAVPALYNALFFQSIVPTLATFMKRDWVKIKRVIWISSLCALLISLTWLWIAISATPSDVMYLIFESYENIYGISHALHKIPFIGKTIYPLMFFPFIASFPILGTVLLDFYSDLFKLTPEKRKGWKRLAICLLAILPPFLLSHIPMVHINVIVNYTLGLSVVLISAVIPLLWIISARYIRTGISYPHHLKIGPPTLVLYAIAVFFLIYFEGVQMIKI